MRIILASLAFLLVTPFALAAQWTVTVQAGVHADRLGQPQRVLTEPSSHFMLSARGEAPVIGLRASNWFAPTSHFGVDAGLAASQNRSWSGGGATPLPDFVKQTVFTSAALLWRPFTATARWQLQLGLGPSAIFHGGSGQSLLARQTDFGAMGTVGAHVSLGQRLRLGIDVYNYRFTSQFADMEMQQPGLPASYMPGARSRSEWLVMPSVRLVF